VSMTLTPPRNGVVNTDDAFDAHVLGVLFDAFTTDDATPTLEPTTAPHDSTSPLVWALWYAEQGFPVFPLWWPTKYADTPEEAVCACGKECSHPGKHPLGRLVPHGRNDATTDPRTIIRWWEEYPLANVGVATGECVNVLDIDDPDAFRQVLPPGPLPITPTYVTGRHGGGVQIWFQGGFLRSIGSDKLPGADVRGKGGSVTVPPSRHYTGNRYEWVTGRGPDLPLAKPPTWLVAKADVNPPPRIVSPTYRFQGSSTSKRYGEKALENLCNEIAQAPQGTRQTTLFSRSLRAMELAFGGELEPDTTYEKLLEAARATGLPEVEITRTLDRVRDQAQANPQTAPTRRPQP